MANGLHRQLAQGHPGTLNRPSSLPDAAARRRRGSRRRRVRPGLVLRSSQPDESLDHVGDFETAGLIDLARHSVAQWRRLATFSLRPLCLGAPGATKHCRATSGAISPGWTCFYHHVQGAAGGSDSSAHGARTLQNAFWLRHRADGGGL